MRTSNRETVVGVFERREQADNAVAELRRVGFQDDDIGFAVRGGEAPEGTSDMNQGGAGEGAATGLLTGGVIGGLVGAAASGLIPGIGPVIAGGILASVLGGAAVGAAAGGLLGALMGLGVPEEEARYYQTEFEAGRIIVTVKAGARFDEADGILRTHGAYDVHRGSARELTSSTHQPTPQAPTLGSNQFSGSRRSWDEVEPTYRDAWERQHGSSGRRWHDEEAGYRFGFEMSHDPRFRERDWSDSEADLQREYGEWSRRHGYRSTTDDPWSQARESVRGTWESLRNRQRAR
ncbi:MAG: hypothetical protein ACKVVP_04420 [Chloroflexota bacterium]